MDHIVDHSIMVGNVTLCLCSHVRQTSPSLNVELATAAALLHDITKPAVLKPGNVIQTPEGICWSLWVIRKWETSSASM